MDESQRDKQVFIICIQLKAVIKKITKIAISSCTFFFFFFVMICGH